MKREALLAILEALSGKCQDDMHDKFSAPGDKVESAMAEAKSEGESMAEEMDEEGSDVMSEDKPEVAAMVEAEDEDADPNDIKAMLAKFMKPKAPGPTKPGTAIMIATEKKKPSFKKGKMNV